MPGPNAGKGGRAPCGAARITGRRTGSKIKRFAILEYISIANFNFMDKNR
jgi:hypothetical protein